MHHIRAYYHFACYVCLERKNLKKCALCKTVSYCGKEHQKLDWKFHKALCNAIALSNKRVPIKNSLTFKDWCNHRFVLKLAWESTIKRALTPSEDSIWMFLPACAVCHSRNVVKTCLKCMCVVYCGEEHWKSDKDNHNRQCITYQLNFKINLFLNQGGTLPNIAINKINDDIENLPDSLHEIITLFDANSKKRVLNCSLAEVATLDSLLSESLDVVGILFYVFKKIHPSLTRTLPKTTMVLHIIGANRVESQKKWDCISEILFHWYKNLVSIDFVLIGPELDDEFFDFDYNLCEYCVSERKFSRKTHRAFYHDIIEEVPKPDLVLALNCGLHEFADTEYDTWKGTLPVLLHYPQVPLVITSYTENEMENDLNRIKDLKGGRYEYVLENELNEYSSSRPLRDWASEKEPFYYHNRFVSIIKKL